MGVSRKGSCSILLDPHGSVWIPILLLDPLGSCWILLDPTGSGGSAGFVGSAESAGSCWILVDALGSCWILLGPAESSRILSIFPAGSWWILLDHLGSSGSWWILLLALHCKFPAAPSCRKHRRGLQIPSLPCHRWGSKFIRGWLKKIPRNSSDGGV